eukprot:4875890-Pleurochrysis_carterae.AAC.1
MSPPYHYPFLDPVSQGDLSSTRLPGCDLIILRSNLDQAVPMKRKVVLGGKMKKHVVITSALRSQEYYTMLASHPISSRKLGEGWCTGNLSKHCFAQ